MQEETLPTITTARLRLRRMTYDDVGDLFTVFSDPEVMRYWSSAPLTEPAQAAPIVEESHEALQSDYRRKWGLARAEDDIVIGTCTLFRIDRSNRRAELGYALGRAHWGQGIMREALTSLIDYAFGTLGLHRLEADVDPRNSASSGLLERLGFVREGLLRERWYVNGEVQDALLYGLLRPEWQARRQRPG